MDWTSPYILSAVVVIPVLLLTMGLFKKDKFVVEGRVRLKVYELEEPFTDNGSRQHSSLVPPKAWASKSRRSSLPKELTLG
jgi:hypothetical protein